MAVNISIGMQRYEGNANESFEETTEQRGQEDLSSSSQPESNPQSNMQYEADVNPPQSNTSIDSPATPAPLLQPEETAPLPTFSRYGMGDTVIMGRPDYTSHSRIGLAKFESSSEREPVDGQSSFANQARPANDPVLSPRIPYSPASAAPIAPATPMPKPGSNGVPASVLVPELKPTTIPATTVTHAPILGGQLVTLMPLARPTNPNALPTPDGLPSNRTPYLYPGLHTAPEQSPHYAIAVTYGREHGYNDDEIMRLAVLMQANRDQNMGREWLSLKPAVLRAAVNAVVRNTDNSFDTSGVFGGQRGYNRVNTQRIPADAATAAYEFSGDGVPQYASAPPEGWVLVEQTVNSLGSSGDGSTDSTTTTLRYYIPQNEINVVDESAYLPLAVAGYMQVPHGYESELSVGADGGVNDLNALDFDPEFGLITRTDNYRPYHADDNDWDRFMGIVVTVGISAGAMAAIGPVIAAGMGASPAGVVAAGAANAVIGSAITTMLQEGEVTFRGLLQAAFSGGMIAGLSTLDSYQALNNLGLGPKNPNIVTSYALRAISITGTSTIRGAIQELIGGRFRDGFTQGVVQGLSGELTRYLNTEIDAGLARQQITPAQANALRELTRFTGSALRAAANPNDPMYAFAQDYLTQLFGPPVATTNTNGGNKIPDDAETQQQIIWAREAIDSGYPETAVGYLNDIVERRAAANPDASRTDIANQLMRELGIKPDTLGFVVGANGNVTVTERVDRPTAVTRLAAAYRAGDRTISDDEATRLANDYINRFGIPPTFAPVMVPYMDIVAPRLTGIEREFADAERALREAIASKDPVAIRNALTAYNTLQAREATVYHQPFTYGEFDMGGYTVADRGRPLSYAEEMRNVGMAFSSIALGTLELGYAGVHNYVVRIVGGLVSIPGLVLNSAEAAAAIQENFKEAYGYELKTDQARAFIAAIMPAAEVIGEIYQHGRAAAVGVFGEGAVTIAETALQAGMEIIGVVNAGRGLTSAIESLPAGSTVRNRLLSRTDDWLFVPDGAPGSTLNAGIRIGGRYIETTTDTMRAAYVGVDYLDPLTNTIKHAPTNEVMAVDHIFPSRDIVRLDGFDTLTRAQQTAILQDTVGLGNLQPLPSSLNSSKGPSLNWTEYKGQPLNADYVQRLQRLQIDAEIAIRRQIAIYQAANAVKGKA